MVLYKDMTAEEQLKWIKQFADFVKNDVPVLVKLKTWNNEHRKKMEMGLKLLQAFPYTQKYVTTALRFGDYDRRVYRIPFYIDKIKKDISAAFTVKDANGNTFAYVPKLQAKRKRGRPTKEEQQLNNIQKPDAETEAQQRIAEIMGMEVITNQPEREKNNTELIEEKTKKQSQLAAISPTLFDTATAPQEENYDFATDVYALPALRQLTFLMSPELAERVNTIRELRTQAGAFAEQAKVMAEHNDPEKMVAEVATQAAKATEAYEQIYEDVDKELATVYIRLKEDATFKEKFVKKHYQNIPKANVAQQLANIQKTLKPYFRKQDKNFAAQVRQIIADNNPEEIARKKAEKEKKNAAEKIIKYLRRNDKENTARRLEGMEQRYKELVALIGEEQAKPYYAFVEAARKDYAKKNK